MIGAVVAAVKSVVFYYRPSFCLSSLFANILSGGSPVVHMWKAQGCNRESPTLPPSPPPTAGPHGPARQQTGGA